MNFEPLRRALARRARRDFPFGSIAPELLPEGGLHHGTVLVPVLEQDGAPALLFIRRHKGLRRHPGQIAFPGGEVDRGEEALDAMLREAEEEIGLEPDRLELLGRLDDTLVLQSPFRLTPWVGRVPYPYPYAAQPAEVEEILFVPLATLTRPGAHRIESGEAYGMRHDVHVYQLGGGDRVWGASARIVSQLLEAWRAT